MLLVIPYYGDLAKIPDELFDKIMNNNVKSNLWLCKKAIPYLKKQQSSSIIIVSSIAGLQGSKKSWSIFHIKNC